MPKMANVLKNIFMFIIATVGFSLCFTTVLQFAVWLYQTGCVSTMRTNTGTTQTSAAELDNIQKSIILHNLLLLLMFVIQHSLMATNICKRLLTVLGLEVVQRSIYIIATCAVLQVLMQYWLPLYPDHPIWAFNHSRHHILWLIFTVVHILAWLVMYGIVLVIDYGELIGVKQVYYFLINSPPPMQIKSSPNRRMFDNFRHPILTGLLLVMWFVPVMTFDRLLLAIFLTLYTCLGHRLDAMDYGYLKSQLRQKQAHLQTAYYGYE